jgi:hypothetical protein
MRLTHAFGEEHVFRINDKNSPMTMPDFGG